MVDMGESYLFCDECMNCDLPWRIKHAEEHGFEPQIEYGWCDKTGGKFIVCGYCEDAFEHKKQTRKSGKRKTGRAYRRKQKWVKERRRRRIINFGWVPTPGYIPYRRIGNEFVEGNHIVYPNSSNAQKFLKRVSNKKVRKYKGEIHKGNAYRKLFDYWWELC